jgi:hypothetical protein
LNDSNREPRPAADLLPRERRDLPRGRRRLRELLLYDGNYCNRDCSWVHGLRLAEGLYREYGEDVSRRPCATSPSTAT